MVTKRKKWTVEENKILDYLRRSLTIDKILDGNHLPGRSKGAIINQCYTLKIGRKYDLWSDTELWECWILNKKLFSTGQIADYLGNRSKGAVSHRMSKDGLFYHPPHSPIPLELQSEVSELLGAEGK